MMVYSPWWSIQDKLAKNVTKEGVIIEWPLNGQFHESCDIIMTFWTNVLSRKKLGIKNS